MTTIRQTVLANGEFYHVFNRGVEKRTIFENKREFNRALDTFKYYRFAKLPLKFSKFIVQPEKIRAELIEKFALKKNELVEIISFCLMPNHFHFLLKQLQDNGTSKFLSNFTNSYTKYFNTKHERVGPLLQGIFKAVRVENNEQLIHLSRYIHLNPVSSFIVSKEKLKNYLWSSYAEYIGETKTSLCAKEYISDQFQSFLDYENFVLDQVSYEKDAEKIKPLVIED